MSHINRLAVSEKCADDYLKRFNERGFSWDDRCELVAAFQTAIKRARADERKRQAKNRRRLNG